MADGSFQSLVVTRQEYLECGSDYCKRKNSSAWLHDEDEEEL